MKQKANMYRAVIKEMDRGTYTSKVEKKYEELYKDFKHWGKTKEPAKLRIHENVGNTLSTRIVVESFAETKALTPKFTPDMPRNYFKARYAGGPNSNKMKIPPLSSSKVEYYATLIQKRFRIFKAKKIMNKRKIEREKLEIEIK
jgi:hypothetical protein